MAADLGRFNKTLVYRRKAPISSLLEDIAELRLFDRKQEKILRLWTIVGFLGLIGAAACAFLLNSAIDKAVGEKTRIGLIAAFVAVMIVGWVIRAWRSGLNLEDRRYELAERVLRFLSRDTKSSSEVLIDLDLRRPNIKEKRVKEGKVGPWKVKYHSDRWLKIQGQFLDGTGYRLNTIEKHQDRRKSYRSSSGKLKTKSKIKTASQLIVSLRVKTKKYPGLAIVKPDQAQQAVQLPEWASLTTCRVAVAPESDRGLLTLKSATTHDWTCDPNGKKETEANSGTRWFAMSILSLYEVLNRSRAPGNS